MKSFFSTDFINHLAAGTNSDPADITALVSSYMSGDFKKPERVVPSKKELPPKATQSPASKSSDDDKKTPDRHCDRIPRGKNTPCGKSAKHFIEGDGVKNWYCGTENSGCYKSILGAVKRQKKAGATSTPVSSPSKSAPTKPTTKQSTTLGGRQKDSDAKSKSLINTVTQRRNLDVKKLNVGKKTYWIDYQSRVLFFRDT